MSIARDGSSRGRDRKTSTNLRAEYTDLINADEGLVEARRWIEVCFVTLRARIFPQSAPIRICCFFYTESDLYAVQEQRFQRFVGRWDTTLRVSVIF